MQTCRDVGGFTPGEVDKVKKAIKYKDPSVFMKLLPIFIEGGKRTSNLNEDQAKEIFSYMAAFASYGFNKAHSMAYGMLSYQTAFLKTKSGVFLEASITSLVLGVFLPSHHHRFAPRSHRLGLGAEEGVSPFV